MKKLLLGALLLLSTSLFSQSFYHIDSLYQDKTNYLIYNTLESIDSLTQDQLITKIKNWGGTNFVNMSEVLVSETKEQLVFNYITSSFYIKILGMKNYLDWYIRLVVQVRDQKIKVSFYDDGNAFRPGTYAGNTYIKAVPARQNKFEDYFKKDGTIGKANGEGLKNTRTSCILKADDLINSIKSNTIYKTDKDW